MAEPTSYLTVRRVPRALVSALSRERRRRNASLNATVIGLLSHALGVETLQEQRSNGLAKLSGKWTSDQMRAFRKATAATRTIDREFWR